QIEPARPLLVRERAEVAVAREQLWIELSHHLVLQQFRRLVLGRGRVDDASDPEALLSEHAVGDLREHGLRYQAVSARLIACSDFELDRVRGGLAPGELVAIGLEHAAQLVELWLHVSSPPVPRPSGSTDRSAPRAHRR